MSSESIPESVLLPHPKTMVSVVAFSILLILVPGLSLEAKKHGRHDSPETCCFQYASHKIRNVVACYETSSRCANPGVVVITNKGRQVCVHPRNAGDCVISPQPEAILKTTGEYDPQTTLPFADSVPYEV
ncbi:C-C motif chemokine 4-like [Trichosurus vulpecula]|uniref:C-C motif chemokine 4-like n=1 Tax=Trichosurus vulpecula TaxID=9337 RepID=UPI00186B30A9|nr:C-C motif chemokine 4-like [Trichosurus vulpecula]XP_036621746.1 C-C motif chemokine 4-like [Trichosurus vulpecula]